MNVITTGVAVARGIGGRRGRARRRLRSTTAQRCNALAKRMAPKWQRSMEETALRYPKAPRLGYRERRRRAKLRRRARDREVSAHLAKDVRGGWDGRWACRTPELRSMRLTYDAPWWATAEGRRAWLASDRDRKRLRRLIARTANASGMVVLPPGVRIEIADGTARYEFDATVRVPMDLA